MTHDGPRQPLKELKSSTMWWVAGAGGSFALTVFLVLFLIAAYGEAERARLWIDVVTRSLTVFAGVGGGFGLWLAFRRQQANERDSRAIKHDATERRITELRIQAVEQLGSDKAVVRIGGLNNLERLGEQYPELRQIVINELCAYLRMPYQPPETSNEPRSPSDESRDENTDLPKSAPIPSSPDEEMQVRLTAQNMLEKHVKKNSRMFWDHDQINLTGAYLFRLYCHNAELNDVDFRGATFAGGSTFAETTFTGDAAFDRAVFQGDNWYMGVTFADTTFKGHTWFGSAEFDAANFPNTTFESGVSFYDAKFRSITNFSNATFGKASTFKYADLTGTINFKGASISLEKPLPPAEVPKGLLLTPDPDRPKWWRFEPIADDANADARQSNHDLGRRHIDIQAVAELTVGGSLAYPGANRMHLHDSSSIWVCRGELSLSEIC